MSEKKTRKRKSTTKVVPIVDTSVLYDVEMSEEMKQSYLDYALSVIMSRALPDVRDGLKPVLRRILYAMYLLKLMPDKPYRKSARIVGDVLGKYHPHGDSAVYLAMVRMAQDFKNTNALVEGHGNFGSIDGDSPAHMRYTEARLRAIAITMLEELENDVVDFRPNFDDSQFEPTVLPCKIPMLLVNGSSGVAVGMATKIPPHNLGEVVDSYIKYLENEDATIEELCKYLKGPDFPTGGVIVNEEEFKEKFYSTGEAKIRIRSKYHIEDGTYGRKNIVITEIPFTLSGSKTKFIEKIADMITNKELEECTEIKDESSKDGMRIVIKVKNNIDIDSLINKLLDKTPMEDGTGYTFLALNEESTPIIYNLKNYYSEVYKFQKDFYRRKYAKLLEGYLDRAEILEGYLKLNDVKRVVVEVFLNTEGDNESECIEAVKNVLTKGEVDYLYETNMMKKYIAIAKEFRFTEKQVKAILRISLPSLMNFQIKGYQKELDELNAQIEKCNKILNSDKELKKLIKKEALDIKKANYKERLTELDNIDKKKYKQVAVEEDVLVLVDKFDYIKVADIPRGYTEEQTKDFKFAKVCKNTDSIRVFTSKGNFVQIKLSDLDRGKIKDRGKPLENYLIFAEDETMLMYDLNSILLTKEFLIATKKGYIKRLQGYELDSRMSSLAYAVLGEDDSVVDIKMFDPESYYEVQVVNTKRTKKVLTKDEIKLVGRRAKGTEIKDTTIKSLKVKEMERPVIEMAPIGEIAISVNPDGSIKLDI